MQKEYKNSNVIKEKRPYRVWDEMAETDVLIEYMRKFVDSNINKLPDLRSTVYDSLYKYSPEVLPEVEIFYGKKLYLTLKTFLDKIELCRNPKQ
jgi:2-phosphoglycerate kinase